MTMEAKAVAQWPKSVKLIVIAGGVLVLDQLTKAAVLRSIPLFGTVEILPGFFNLTHVLNPGGAFGFLAGQSSALRKFFFIFASTAAVCVILYLYRKTPPSHPLLATALALIFGGAIGNLIDRVRFGRVVDFLDVHAGRWHWPAFNIADSAISVGIVIFVMQLLLRRMPD
jgi:signal peptidase II